MRAALRVHALVGKAQPLDWLPAYQVLAHNFFSVFGLHVSVPDGVGIHHHRGPVLTLVQAAGLVDAHLRAQSGLARKLLQPCVQLALSIAGTRRPRRIGGPRVVTDKNVAFKWGQEADLLSPFNLVQLISD
jgi:hypothetical protein